MSEKGHFVLMRIIKPKTIGDWARIHAVAGASLAKWMEVVKAARWTEFADLRRTFSSADQVRVASGRTVVVFDIAGKRFRLIGAVHYVTGLVFALRFLTHAEYTKDRWKNEL